MKKWILTGLAILLAALLAVAGLYSSALHPLKTARAQAEAKALDSNLLQSADEYYLYNGSASYSVVIGKDADGEKTVVFLPEKGNAEPTVMKWSDGISKEKAFNMVQEEARPKKVLGVRLGMEQDIPIWEISYLDENSTLNYMYIQFETGKWWRKIKNL